MRMHDPSLGDDVIEQPEPITLFLPILEASLRRAGIRPGRDEMIRRFMTGEPRVVIVGRGAGPSGPDRRRRRLEAGGGGALERGRAALRDHGARGVRRHRAGPLRDDVLPRLAQHHDRAAGVPHRSPLLRRGAAPRLLRQAAGGRRGGGGRDRHLPAPPREEAVLRLLHPRPRDAGEPPAPGHRAKASAPSAARRGRPTTRRSTRSSCTA